MSDYKKGLFVIVSLIIVTGTALAYVGGRSDGHVDPPPQITHTRDGRVTVTATLAQTKVLTGSDGQVSMAVNLAAAALPEDGELAENPVDLVVVLDRSGSMNGQKINDACRAIRQLLERLTPRDRLALVTYANDVTRLTDLTPANDANQGMLAALVDQVRAGGGTNLGGGLQMGIDTLLQGGPVMSRRKLILISDGLANQGITDPDRLGTMASVAMENGFSISTVGVGLDFNEILMTAIADHGAGQYHFMENPQAFAQVFADECRVARQVAASAFTIKIPVANGVRLIHAGGYPVTVKKGVAEIHPGDLLSGQERRLFFTFAVPVHRTGEFTFDEMALDYQYQGKTFAMTVPLGLSVACVPDPAVVAASVDRETWSQQVLQEDYSRLKATVADAIRKGDKEAAEARIQAYEAKTLRLNENVGSAKVTQNLKDDLPQLRKRVETTFAGAPAAVAEKRKQQSKALQYDSYQIRRAK